MVCDIGEVYGRLRVVKEAPKRAGQRYVICCCECGKYVTVAVKNLRSGKVKSCGCFKRDVMSEALKLANKLKE